MDIQLENVSYINQGKTILNDINWQVRTGENWILFGLNGSGKTTLLNLITGYFYPSKGKAEVLGYTFGKAPLSELRKHIGWVSSALNEKIPSEDTLKEVIISGLHASLGLWEGVTPKEEIQAGLVLSRLGMKHLADRKYRLLSQGEKQKAMIGRALIQKPQILIFDEVYNGLDIFARKVVEDIIFKLSEGEETLIFVSHNTEDIPSTFNKVLMLKDGSVFGAGLTRGLITKENLSAFYGNEVDVTWYQGHFYISLTS